MTDFRHLQADFLSIRAELLRSTLTHSNHTIPTPAFVSLRAFLKRSLPFLFAACDGCVDVVQRHHAAGVGGFRLCKAGERFTHGGGILLRSLFSGDRNGILDKGAVGGRPGATMATTLTLSHPQFVYVFAAVRRADRTPRICMLRTVAGDEHAARLNLVRDYILAFAGRLPVAEVRA